MKPFIQLLILVSVVTLFSCDKKTQTEANSKETTTKVDAPKKEKRSFPLAHKNGKFIQKGDKKYLYGGEDSTWHFDISNSILKDEQYHFGIGREKFDALITPEFMSVNVADTIYPDSARFLLLEINDDVRAYGIDLLTHHEIVNDIVGGKPVMAAYCILADLGAVYDRAYGDKVFTYALSGYTYFDPEVWDGMDGFVFWDRETESTWWPLIGKAVSGDMIETPLNVYNKENWSQTDWGYIKSKYPNAKVLKPNQKMDSPDSWEKFSGDDIRGIIKNAIEVAPKWGENK